MTLNKMNFEYIKGMINSNESLNTLKAFCKGLGLNTEKYTSPVYVSNEQIAITYRRKTYYVDFFHSKIHGTTYFNKI